jgi:drug/metabolite transporter (DMT)-like permease
MPPLRLIGLILAAMLAFAANSLLCRVALRDTAIDPATFTTLRLVSGAVVLWALVKIRASASTPTSVGGSWGSALALFVYAAAFSLAYVTLSAGTGALLLFGAVQVTMVLGGWRGGERPTLRQALGIVLAFAGLIVLVLPGLSAPPWIGSSLMLLAGIAWGIYSLRGRGISDASAATAGNFLRAVPMALVLSAVMFAALRWDARGALYAVASGAIASGLGYTIWYTALRDLRATSAASVQLSVPVLAAIGGIVFLGEAPSLRLATAAVAILGGIALVLQRPRTVAD